MLKKLIFTFPIAILLVIGSSTILTTSALAIGDNQTTKSCHNFVYKFGYRATDAETNGEVSVLQNFLISNNYLEGQASGFFGPKTVAAVKKFQTANNISSTGTVGVITGGKIKAITCDKVSGLTSATNSASTDSAVKSSNQDIIALQKQIDLLQNQIRAQQYARQALFGDCAQNATFNAATGQPCENKSISPSTASACPPTSIVQLYSEPYYKGDCLGLDVDASNLADYNFDNKVSSLKVRPGYFVTLKVNPNYEGKGTVEEGNTPGFGKESLNKTISSMKISKKIPTSIKLLSQQSDEIWTSGNAYTVRWESPNNTGDVTISLSGVKETHRIPGSGGDSYYYNSCQITVPVIDNSFTFNLKPGFLCSDMGYGKSPMMNDKYTLDLGLKTGEGLNYARAVAKGKITITGLPSVVVSSPINYETWKVGNTYSIKWGATAIDSVNINLACGYPRKLINIADNIPASQGSYAWTIPTDLDSACREGGPTQIRFSSSMYPDMFWSNPGSFIFTIAR